MSRQKQLYVLILILLSTLLCISCKQESTTTKEPTYNIFQSPESTDVSSIITDIPSTPADANMPNGDNTLNISPTDSSLKDEPWPYPIDFKGVSINPAVSYKTGNLICNINGIDPTQSYMICPDLDKDMIYYVNYGNDNYIYKLKDGVSTLVVEKEAFQLSIWDNKLYFLSRHENNDLNIGDIYCYNLETSELQLLQKANAMYLLVDSLGIYYEDMSNRETNERMYYRMDFDGSNLKKLDNRYYLSYYDYQIIQNERGVILQHNDTKDEYFIAPYEYGRWGLTIYDDQIILHRDGVFYLINLLNGDKKAIKYSNSKSQVVDYVIIDNNMYLCSQIIDLSTGTVIEYSSTYVEKKDNFMPEYLFTDGNQIYSTVYYPYLAIRKLLKLEYGDTKLEYTGSYELYVKELGE